MIQRILRKLFTPLTKLVPSHHGYARRYEAHIPYFIIKNAWDDFDLTQECISIPKLLQELRLRLIHQATNEFRVIDEMKWYEYNDYTIEEYQMWGYPNITIVLFVTGEAL